jgi:superfamily I DNA/RNA helicase/mRNA-degrading endonuclease RelE of RelBE toxin-antitoxin system
MARLAISKDYFPAYAGLPRKAQRKADEFLRKFEQDSTGAAIHLEPIQRSVDKQLRSARIGDDYRMIVRAPEHGDVFLVLWADHHDEAYRWAATKQTAVHPATGSLQIFDVTAASEALTTAPDHAVATWREPVAPTPQPPASDAAIPDPPDLFESHSDDDLFLAGVPRALLPSVRALGTDADLDRLLPHLPPEAGEVLTALAAGIPLDDALEEVLGRVAPPAAAPTPPPIDVTDVPAALARDTTQRQFLLLEDGLDLDAALKHPLDVWRVFLHPRQRRLAYARTKGPTRVLGGAGTGKTVVALHRAAFLVRDVFTKPDDRVLFTTFTVNLAQDLRSQLGKLLEPDALARVEVVNIDSWASTYLRGRGIAVRPAFDKEQRQHFNAAHEVYGQDDVALDFYRAEWRDVIQEQGLRTEDEYVRAVRKTRGVPLGRAGRRRLWPVFAAYRDNLEHAGLMEPLDILRRARATLEAANEPPRYRSVVVDETQDFSADGLRLLRAIAGPERPDDLFLVGDAHQRIYGRPVALSQCGIQVRGRRSQTLRLNYRTTGAICRWSLAILKDVAVDDLDDGAADRRGYVSLREGPPPNVHGFSSSIEEERVVVERAKAYIEAGVPAEAICVVARTGGPLRDRFGPALQRAGIGTVLLEQEEPRLPGVRMATMHRVKGLEFAVVLLVGVSKHDVPLSTPELRSEDPVMSAQALLRERSLLYVAASRARDHLHVFYTGEASAFVAALGGPKTSAVATAPAPARLPIPAVISRPPPVEAVEEPKESMGSEAERIAGILATSLADVGLPTRMMNWAERMGLSNLGDLARRAPSDLLAEKNLGRKSVQDSRLVVERATGRRWEELVGEVHEPSVPSARPNGNRAASSWDELRRLLSDEERAILLSTIVMPARLSNYVEREKFQTLGDLAKQSRAELMAVPNLGRGSIADLPRLIAEHLKAASAAETFVGEGLLESFKAGVEQLDPMLRMIATRRSGLGGEPMTLQELGDMFGVSRERVRQLETKVCEQLARQPWTREARRRVEDVLVGGASRLEELASDRWWAAASAMPDVVDFVVDRVLATGAFILELNDTAWLSRHKDTEVAHAWSGLVAAAELVALPASTRAFDALVDKATASLGPRLKAHFGEELRARMQLEEGSDPGSERVMAFGDTLNAEVLAILRAAPEPMHVDEINRQVGRRRTGKLPDEVLHFRRGYVGLRQHFPDFEKWQARLVPACVQLIKDLGPDRQWYCGELLDELREEHDIPDWLTAPALAELIQADGTLRYLGRARVVLPGSQEDDARVYMHDALEDFIRDAGVPVKKAEIVEKLGKRLGTSEFGIQTVFNRPQFVRLDEDRIGLLSRDVPGGAAAIAEAADHMEAVLARRARGLSDVHAHDEIVGLSSEHATWTRLLTISVLRSDGRFRFNQSGAVGLATWDSTRVPTRLELLRNALDEAAGRVSVEAITARIAAHYGDRPSRGGLVNLGIGVGASLDGEWVVRKTAGDVG